MTQLLRKGSLHLGVAALVVGLLAVSAQSALAQNELKVTDGSSLGLVNGNIELQLTNADPVEGYVAAVEYDTTKVSVLLIDTAGTVTDAAELVVPEIFEAQGGFTLGVVLDSSPPFDGQTIAPGASQTLANVTVMPDVNVAVEEYVDFTLVDNVLNSPPLSNIVVIGGLSVGDGGGLTLDDGVYTLLVAPDSELHIVGGAIDQGGSTCAQVTMTNSGEVQGFVLAIAHDAGLNLIDINIDGTATFAVGAEFVVPNNLGTGGTLGVVLDFSPPFDGQTIPIGADQHIANFCYSCVSHPTEPDPASAHALTFVDGVLGSPALDNVLVVAGLSIDPLLIDGEMTCNPVPLEDTEYWCGQMDSEGNVVDVVGAPGETVQFCFFWSDPTDNINGFQLAVCFDCELFFIEGTFSVEGTILEEVGAEFVNHHVDNDPHDGDGCELVVGILLDALPPFDRQTVPPTAIPLKLGCIDVTINGDCDECYDIWFCDNINGRGQVLIENVVVVDTVRSVKGFGKHPCQICVDAPDEFVRGDCNCDLWVNIADASTVLAQQFQGYLACCLDACDANDDGKINLADSVYILNYMFKFGPVPPDPFPGLGPDTTIDDPSGLHYELDCEDGVDPCP